MSFVGGSIVRTAEKDVALCCAKSNDRLAGILRRAGDAEQKGPAGLRGIGDDHYPLPWQSLKYDTNLEIHRVAHQAVLTPDELLVTFLGR
jgi:hypothetical protein